MSARRTAKAGRAYRMPPVGNTGALATDIVTGVLLVR